MYNLKLKGVEHQTKQFQTLIGQLQWLISLGYFDIAVHFMSLSRFRAQPRKGHLDRAKRIVGYLLFLPDGAIIFSTGEPDFSSLKDQENMIGPEVSTLELVSRSHMTFPNP